MGWHARGHGFESTSMRNIFFIFVFFAIFELAITSLGGMGDLPTFIKPSYVPTGSYHININSVVSCGLFTILLSKITDFSPKNLTFSPIKLDRVVPVTWQ